MIKEVAYYEKEVKENEATLEEMKAAEKDPYDIKKFKEVLGESYMMIPDSKSRLQRTLVDLEEYVASPEVVENESLKYNEWYLQATELLTKRKEELEGTSGDDGVQETDVGGLEEGEAF
jgi:tubulin-specific chaperone A